MEGNQTGTAERPPLKLAGPRSGIQKERFVVVRDKKALEALLKEHNPQGEVDTKTLDFSKYSVVGYFAGTKSTGGYSVELTGVDRTKESANLRIRLLKPPKDAFVIQILTTPFFIQAVEKLPAKVTYTVVEQERPAR